MCNIPGFVALSSFDSRTPTGHHSAEWKTLMAAIERKELSAFQDASSRRYYVNHAEALSLLDAANEERADANRDQGDRHIELLERIAASVERQEEILRQMALRQ